jgi:hypothetical protein
LEATDPAQQGELESQADQWRAMAAEAAHLIREIEGKRGNPFP